MRNKKWILAHRGGTLTIERQKQLMRWATDCVSHLLPLLDNTINNNTIDNTIEKIKNAVIIGNNWINGEATTGDAMRCSREMVKYARTLDNDLEIAIARAAGHAVATAHMADHSMGPVYYGTKAMTIKGNPTETELNWQIEHIPREIKEFVVEGLKHKGMIK